MEKAFFSREISIELARRSLWHYCKALYPEFYTDDRTYLKDLCSLMQAKTPKLMVNMPPRTGKSLTLTLAETWFIGHNQEERVISVSYNDTLAGRFSKGVRATIEATRIDNSIIFSDIFPGVKIKKGDGAAQLWSVEGSFFTFMGSGMGSSITGTGASLLVVDDIIKNAKEAYTSHVLEEHYHFYKNTLLSRLETGGRVIINMTRWAKDDLCGMLLAEDKDAWVVYSKSIEDCQGIMTAEEIADKKKIIDPEIWEANYKQNIIDSANALYSEGFRTINVPSDDPRIIVIDVADKGTDFLAAASFVKNGDAIDVYSTFMDSTELADLEDKLVRWIESQDVSRVHIESNNVGNYFSKQLKKRLPALPIRTYHSSANKEARIKASSWWCMDNVRFHKSVLSSDFYRHLLGFKSKFRANKHDDPEDVMAAIYELFGVKNKKLKAGVRI